MKKQKDEIEILIGKVLQRSTQGRRNFAIEVL